MEMNIEYVKELEARAKMSEEIIHQRYIDDCKELSAHIVIGRPHVRDKARLYSELPSYMKDEFITEHFVEDDSFLTFLSVMLNAMEEYFPTSEMYDSMPEARQEGIPYDAVERFTECISGTFEDLLEVFKIDLKLLIRVGAFGCSSRDYDKFKMYSICLAFEKYQKIYYGYLGSLTCETCPKEDE